MLKKEDYINCVCLIINGRLSCANASLKYVLTEITAILPREILQNVIIVFTNTSDPFDLTFDINELTEYFGRPVSQELTTLWLSQQLPRRMWLAQNILYLRILQLCKEQIIRALYVATIIHITIMMQLFLEKLKRCKT